MTVEKLKWVEIKTLNVKLDNKTSRITTNNVRNHIFIANNCDFLAANAFCKLKKTKITDDHRRNLNYFCQN